MACFIAAALVGCRDDRAGLAPAGDFSCPGCNLILVSIDTLRADHLGAYGYGRDTSPNFDAFASRSVRFEHAFSASRKTAPSHMSLFTSLYPTVHGVFMDKAAPGTESTPYLLDEKVRTLAQVLGAQGYATAAWHGGGHVSAVYGFDRGFEIYQNHSSHLTGPKKRRRYAEEQWQPAMQWLESRADEPFFLFLHTFATHDPYQPPEPYFSLFRQDGAIRPERGPRSAHGDYWRQVDPDSPADVENLVDLYDSAIRFTDEQLLAPLLGFLESSGLLERSIVVLLSDHGEEFMEHGKFRHDQVYDEILHVPLVIYLPPAFAAAGSPPALVSQQVSGIDLMPTLLDLLGVSYDASGFQGRSLAPLLSGANRSERPVYSVAVYGTWKRGEAEIEDALRGDGYKVIYKLVPEARIELYQTDSDPREQTDLAEVEPELAAKLATALLELRQRNAAFRSRQGYRNTGAEYSESVVEELRSLGYIN